MEFSEMILELSNLVSERMQYIKNEEATKLSLINPFIKKMGYDVDDPREVIPEYVADFGKKKGEKVDYAILSNEKAIIFIEAKAINENLDDHDSQLSRYFNSTPNVKLAILTNGTRYKFFTDLNEQNIMDETPFFELDILNLNDNSISFLQNFHKNNFNSLQVKNLAQELIDTRNIDFLLTSQLENPTDDFIKFLIKDLTKDKATPSTIDRFRIIIKKTVKKYHLINDQKMLNDFKVKNNDSLKIDIEFNDISNDQNDIYTNKNIKSIEFLNKEYKITSWKHMLFTICDILINLHNKEFKNVLTLKGTKKSYFSKNENDLRRPEKINNTDIYVETNLSSGSIVKLCNKTIALFNYSDDDLKIKT